MKSKDLYLLTCLSLMGAGVFAAQGTMATLPSTSSTTTQRVAIPSSICNEIQDIQFFPYDWTSFGFAILRISFY